MTYFNAATGLVLLENSPRQERDGLLCLTAAVLTSKCKQVMMNLREPDNLFILLRGRKAWLFNKTGWLGIYA